MESKASSGQILIETALALVVFAILLSSLVNLDGSQRRRHKRIQDKQTLDFKQYRNGK